MCIHFDAATLFPAMVMMVSMVVTLNVYVALEYNMASHMNGRYNKTFGFSFEKNGKCIKLEKLEQERKNELKNIIRKRKRQLYWGNRM